MLLASWLSEFVRVVYPIRRRRRCQCSDNIAAFVEVFEAKALLSGYASGETLSLPHSTASLTQTATTSVIYMDYDGPVSAVITTPPTKGTAIDNADGTFTYTANINEVGSDSFTYAMTDLDGVTHNATVTIDIGNNDAFANSDSAMLPHSTPTTTQAWTSSSLYGDMDGDLVTVTITTSPTKGTVVDNGDGTFTYTANVNEIGSDSFAFSVTDSLPGATAQTGAVNITLSNNDAFATSDSAMLPHSTPTTTQTWTSSSLYGDMDGDLVTVTITTSPTKGTVVDNGDGTFTYTTSANQVGTDAIVFTVGDGLGAVVTATVTITQTNSEPQLAANDTGEAMIEEPTSSSGFIVGQLVATDTEGDAVTYSIDPNSYFTINSITGELILIDGDLLEWDAETLFPDEIEIGVHATDVTVHGVGIEVGLCAD